MFKMSCKKTIILGIVLAVLLTFAPSALAENIEAEVPAGKVAYNKDYDKYYDTLEEALGEAETGELVVLVDDYDLKTPTDVPAGVRLLIPNDDTWTYNLTGSNNVSGDGDPNGTAYVTLGIPANMTLTVYGALLVAGNQQSTQPKSGFLTGNYGNINLQGNILVETGGELYARGEIMSTGETTGTVTAKSGSSVYERFQIADWRGGTASDHAKNNGVFPFDLYDLGGISANLVLNSGAQLYGQAFIRAASRNISMNIPVISYSGEVVTEEYEFEGSIITMFGTNGTVTFTTAANNVKTITVKNATLRTGNLSYSLKILGFEIFGFDSAGMDCPFGYHMNVVLDQGATMEVGTMLKIMPQCTFTVKDGANLIITDGHKTNGDVVHGSMNFYGKDGFKKEYYFGTAATWTYTDPARLTVETGGEVEVGDANTISSTDQAFTNVDGFEAASDEATVPVLEWNQTADEKVTVWFFEGTHKPVTPPTPAE